MRLDSHQHFWKYDSQQFDWITDRMAVLKRDFLPSDLLPLLNSIGFDGSIAVQARQTEEETEWLLDLADRHDFIKGVVGWVDLRSPQLPQKLDQFSHHKKLRGVRHVLQDEPDDQFMLLPDFLRGIGELKRHGLTYDLLLYPRHLSIAVELVRQFPEQPFVLDHIAKPAIKDRQFSPWREDLRQLAAHQNVWCKLSGMVTEAVWDQWRPDDFHRYLDVVVEALGPHRLMIGSDWPVCLVAGEYRTVMEVVMKYVEQFPPEIRGGILGENCRRFYGIE